MKTRRLLPMNLKWIMPFVLAGIFYSVFIWRTGFQVNGKMVFTLLDDAMISMRYARNLAHGFGLVWNPLEAPVEGYTNFLWTLYMAALHNLPLSENMLSLVVSITGALILIILGYVNRRIAWLISDGNEHVAFIASILTLFYYPLLHWTLRGMEVGLLALLIQCLVLCAIILQSAFSIRMLICAGALVFAALLVRDDAVIPCFIICSFILFGAASRRSLLVLSVLLSAAVISKGIHTVFRFIYYDDFLPNTYYLKVTGVYLCTRVVRGVNFLKQLIVVRFFVPFLLVVANLLPVSGFRPNRNLEYLLVCVFVFQCVYSVYVGGDAWEWMLFANRYIALGVPSLLVLVALGVVRFASWLSVENRAVNRRAFAILSLFLALLVLGILSVPSNYPDFLGRFSVLQVYGSIWILLCVAGCFLVSIYGVKWLIPWGRNMESGMCCLASLSSLIILACVCAGPYGYWIRHNAHYVDSEHYFTKLGLFLRENTLPSTTIALSRAGAIAYYANRSCVDLLGKNDKDVARMVPRGPFLPGHNKYDYPATIKKHMPDLVVDMWNVTEADQKAIVSLGYAELPNGILIRENVTIDRERLGQSWN